MLLAGFGRVEMNGEEVAWIQSVEWVLTTPFIVYNTGRAFAAPSSALQALVLYDVMMIITGFCGASLSLVFISICPRGLVSLVPRPQGDGLP